MATLNLEKVWRAVAPLALAAGIFSASRSIGADDAVAGTNFFLAYYQRLYAEALTGWKNDTNSAKVSWELGRACYDRADFATNNAERAALAEQGMAACRRAIELETNSAPAHYFLALNTGQLARTKLFTALYLVDYMEKAMQDSIVIDEKYDFAGGHRALGVLYRDAPGWPVSIGSRSKSRRHLDKAVELFPDFPGNQIHLLESWLSWGDRNRVAKQIPIVEKILKSSRTNLTGDTWAASWAEWDRSWKEIKTKVQPARNPPPGQ